MYLDSKFPFLHRGQPVPTKPTVTETYDISPEALPEVLRLYDIWWSTPHYQDARAGWDFWAAISRDVPAVARDPQGWTFKKRHNLNYYVTRDI